MIPDFGSIFTSAWTAFSQSNIFFYVKVIAAFATAVLLIADILLISKRVRTDIRVSLYGSGAPRMKKSKYLPRWESIKRRRDEKSVASLKFALIDSDKMLNEVLGILGYAGKDTAEKISSIKTGQLVGIDDLREVQSLHKKIIDDPAYEIDQEELKAALEVYERVLKGLDVV